MVAPNIIFLASKIASSSKIPEAVDAHLYECSVKIEKDVKDGDGFSVVYGIQDGVSEVGGLE